MFLSALQLIIDRLTSQALPTVKVFGAYNFEGVKNHSNYAPAYHVVYAGHQAPTDTVGYDGSVIVVPQTWYVFVVARSYTATLTGEPVIASADALCDNVLESLCGYKLSSKHGNLILSSPPGFDGGDPAYTFIPFAFTSKLTIHGVCY